MAQRRRSIIILSLSILVLLIIAVTVIHTATQGGTPWAPGPLGHMHLPHSSNGYSRLY